MQLLSQGVAQRIASIAQVTLSTTGIFSWGMLSEDFACCLPQERITQLNGKVRTARRETNNQNIVSVSSRQSSFVKGRVSA
jgi:hypothetical protein